MLVYGKRFLTHPGASASQSESHAEPLTKANFLVYSLAPIASLSKFSVALLEILVALLEIP